jgi:hypothetical protein
MAMVPFFQRRRSRGIPSQTSGTHRKLNKLEMVMGMVKNWQMKEAENERRDEVREWLQNKLGRQPTEAEIDGYWDEFELAEAFDQDWDSPGWA